MVQEIINYIESHDKISNKIFLLGMAESGPVNTPIKVNSLSHAVSIFGYTGDLIDTYRAIVETNCDCEVYIVKVTGVHSDLYLNINECYGGIIKNGFYIKSKYANEKYNDVKVIIDNDAMYIHYDSKELGDYIKEYNFKDYPTVYDLVEGINSDGRLLKGEVYCYATCDPSTLSVSAFGPVNNSINKLSGGNSGLYYNKNMLYNCLDHTYGILEGEEIDIIVPVGAFYDDTFEDITLNNSDYFDLNREYLTLKEVDNSRYKSYYKQLLEFCIKQLRHSVITHGLMGTNLTKSPFIDEKKLIAKLSYIKDLNYYKEYEKYMMLISVCVGDIYTNYGTRVLNSYAVYAPLIASIQMTENTTNKKIMGSFTLYNIFSNETIREFMKLGFVCLRYSPLEKTVVVATGVTTSNNEDFKFLCNIRMIQLTIFYLRIFYSTLIGKSLNQILKTRELEIGVNAILQKLSNENILKGYSINIISNLLTGNVLIGLSLKTIYMVENFDTYTGIGI